MPDVPDKNQSRATIWTPKDVTPLLVNNPIISSLDSATWEGIVLERRCVPPWEADVAHQTHHLLALWLSDPFTYRHVNEGRSIEGLRVPGSTTVMPVGHSGYWRWDGTAESVNIHICPDFLSRVADPYLTRSDRIEIRFCTLIADPQIEYIGKALLSELEQGAPGGRLFGESLAIALAVHLLRRYTVNSPTVPVLKAKFTRSELRRALDYIHDNLKSDLSLRDLADVAGVSTNHFASLFKQATGLAPHQYVIHQRVEKAKTLLRQSDLSIGEIALLLGFYDASHLNRHFKRLTGLTPRALRSQL